MGDDHGNGIMFVMGLAIGLVIGCVGGGCGATHNERVDAIKAGAGRWVGNPNTGETTFEYVRGK